MSPQHARSKRRTSPCGRRTSTARTARASGSWPAPARPANSLTSSSPAPATAQHRRPWQRWHCSTSTSPTCAPVRVTSTSPPRLTWPAPRASPSSSSRAGQQRQRFAHPERHERHAGVRRALRNRGARYGSRVRGHGIPHPQGHRRVCRGAGTGRCPRLSGGIGERSPRLRAAVLCDLQVLGVELDSEANGRGSYGERPITAPTSRIPEWEIARACTSLLTDPPRIDSRSRPGLGPRPRGAAGPLV